MNAAHDFARRHGLRRLSMEAIAGEAGVSRAALYRQFPNKKALLDAVLEHNSAMVYAAMTKEFGDSATLADKVAIGARYALLPTADVLPIAASDPESFAVLLATGAHPFLARSMQFWRPHVVEAQATGEIAAVLDTSETAEWVARSLLSFMSVRPVSLDATDPRAVEEFARQYVVYGLRTI